MTVFQSFSKFLKAEKDPGHLIEGAEDNWEIDYNEKSFSNDFIFPVGMSTGHIERNFREAQVPNTPISAVILVKE